MALFPGTAKIIQKLLSFGADVKVFFLHIRCIFFGNIGTHSVRLIFMEPVFELILCFYDLTSFHPQLLCPRQGPKGRASFLLLQVERQNE